MKLMEFKVITPEDPWALPVPMVKFMFTTDDEILSFIVEDKLSLNQLDEYLGDCLDKDKIMSVVKQHFAEEDIGETELSKITGVAKIKRLLPSED
jgi:hypothetical protein